MSIAYTISVRVSIIGVIRRSHVPTLQAHFPFQPVPEISPGGWWIPWIPRASLGSKLRLNSADPLSLDATATATVIHRQTIGCLPGLYYHQWDSGLGIAHHARGNYAFFVYGPRSVRTSRYNVFSSSFIIHHSSFEGHFRLSDIDDLFGIDKGQTLIKATAYKTVYCS